MRAIDGMQSVTQEMSAVGKRIRSRQDHEADYTKLCKLVDKARQHLQVILSNSDILKD